MLLRVPHGDPWHADHSLSAPTAVTSASHPRHTSVPPRVPHVCPPRQVPNVVQYYDLHATTDWIYLGFERCLGSLAAVLALDGTPPPAPLTARAERLRWPGERVAALREVAEALAALHAEGVSHNDLNASNVLVARDEALKLHDLQLSVQVAPTALSTSYSLTTFANAGLEINRSRRAPEVLQGHDRLTPKVDIWHLGMLAYQLLAARPSPFAAARGAPDAAAQEDRNILRGACDLSALAHPRLPLSGRERVEATHLLAACLRVHPRARPSIGTLLGHPLFWDASDAVQAIRILRQSDVSEAAMASVLEEAGLEHLYRALVDWQDRVHAPLLEALTAFQGAAGYGSGLAQLLRFVRNAHEHPPACMDAFVTGARGAVSSSAGERSRQEAVARHVMEAVPELPLCVYVALKSAGWEGFS